jgi:hypothetical protein
MKAWNKNSGVYCEYSKKNFKSELTRDKYWRIQAHLEFDEIWEWKRKHRVALKELWFGKGHRSKMYVVLARKMNMSRSECHMWKMNTEQCREVIEFSLSWKKKYMNGRIWKYVESKSEEVE